MKVPLLITHSLVYSKASSRHRGFMERNGIYMISQVWTNGNVTIPTDFHIYDIDQDAKNLKNHFQEIFRSWYLQNIVYLK